jgi:hypothetical protein
MSQLRELRFPSIPALALYAAALVAEIPVVFARMLLTLAAVALVLLLKGESPQAAEGLVELALIPTGWAVLALITPFGGGWWWRANMGGRDPSERERTAYRDALDLLLHHATQPVRLPSIWFVIDSPQPDAAVCGNTLMLSRGLLESEYLPAVLAHELGHRSRSPRSTATRPPRSANASSPKAPAGYPTPRSTRHSTSSHRSSRWQSSTGTSSSTPPAGDAAV